MRWAHPLATAVAQGKARAASDTRHLPPKRVARAPRVEVRSIESTLREVCVVEHDMPAQCREPSRAVPPRALQTAASADQTATGQLARVSRGGRGAPDLLMEAPKLVLVVLVVQRLGPAARQRLGVAWRGMAWHSTRRHGAASRSGGLHLRVKSRFPSTMMNMSTASYLPTATASSTHSRRLQSPLPQRTAGFAPKRARGRLITCGMRAGGVWGGRGLPGGTSHVRECRASAFHC